MRKTKEAGGLKLPLYHPSANLRQDLPADTKAAYERKIGNFDQEGRERILIAMMKVNFLKRLESSIDSFRLTLERTIGKIDTLDRRMAAFESHRDAHPEVDFDMVDPEDVDDGETDPEEFKIGGRHRIHPGHIDIPKWRQSLSHDRTELQFLLDRAKPVTAARDAKLQCLKTLLTARRQLLRGRAAAHCAAAARPQGALPEALRHHPEREGIGSRRPVPAKAARTGGIRRRH